MHPEKTIRGRFHNELDALGVDCYTIYTQDRWHPFVYIPHELDPNLFYPEAMSGAPKSTFCHEIVAQIWPRDTAAQAYGHDAHHEFTLPEKLRGVFFRNAASIPRFEPTFGPSKFGKYAPLFSEFYSRESILSAAVFCPQKPAIAGSNKPELIFFNFRTAHEFLPAQRHKLALLANAILGTLDAEVTRRTASWRSVLIKTIQCQSSVTRCFNESLVHGHGTEAAETCVRRLLIVLHSYLKLEDEDLLVSAYLLAADHGNLQLKRCGDQIGGKGTPKLELQECSGDENASITVCTALTGRSHLLNYVDPSGQTSIEITDTQYNQLAAMALPSEQLMLESAVGRRPARLILLHGEVHLDTLDWDALRTFFSQRALSGIFARLYARFQCQFAHIFGNLDSTWSRPCSEVCVPIVVGDDTIGCVNIESNYTHRFNPSSLNVLASVGAIFGAAVVHRDNTFLLDAIQRCAEGFHTTVKLDRESLGLDKLAAQVALNLGCREVSIDALTEIGVAVPRYYRIASSTQDELVGMQAPTGIPTDWTLFVAQNANRCEQFRSLVLANTGDSLSAYNVLFVKTDNNQNDFAQAPIEQFTLVPAEAFSVRQDTALLQYDLVIGVPLLTPDELGRPTCVGVMWASYCQRRFNVTSDHPWDQVQRSLYLDHVICIAKRCSIIPVTLRSRVWEELRYRKSIHHGGFINIIERTSEHICRGIESISIGAGVEDALHRARLLSGYLCTHFNVSRHVYRNVDVAELRTRLGNSGRERLLSLAEHVQRAWDITQDLHAFKRPPELSLPKGSAIDITVFTSSDYLIELVVMILTNSLLHGKNEKTGFRRIAINWDASEIEHDNLLPVLFLDDGPGFPSSVLGSQNDVPWRYFDGSGEHGFGIMLIKRLGEIMSGKVPINTNGDNGGANWTVWLPVVSGNSAKSNMENTI